MKSWESAESFDVHDFKILLLSRRVEVSSFTHGKGVTLLSCTHNQPRLNEDNSAGPIMSTNNEKNPTAYWFSITHFFQKNVVRATSAIQKLCCKKSRGLCAQKRDTWPACPLAVNHYVVHSANLWNIAKRFFHKKLLEKLKLCHIYAVYPANCNTT